MDKKARKMSYRKAGKRFIRGYISEKKRNRIEISTEMKDFLSRDFDTIK